MSRFMENAITTVIAIAIVGSPLWVIITATVWVESAACHSKGAAMHMPATWGPLQDCVIEYQPGKFIPLDNYRAAEIHK